MESAPPRPAQTSNAVASSSTSGKHKKSKKQKQRVPVTAINPPVRRPSDASAHDRSTTSVSGVRIQPKSMIDMDRSAKRDAADGREVKPMPSSLHSGKKKKKEKRPGAEIVRDGGNEAGRGVANAVQEDNADTPPPTGSTSRKKNKRKAEVFDIDDAPEPSHRPLSTDTTPDEDAERMDQHPARKHARIDRVPQTKQEAEVQAEGTESHSKHFANRTPTVLPGRTYSLAQAAEQSRIARRKEKIAVFPMSGLCEKRLKPSEGTRKVHPTEIDSSVQTSTALDIPHNGAGSFPQSKAEPLARLQAQREAYQTEQKLKETIQRKQDELERLQKDLDEMKKQVQFKDSSIVEQQRMIDQVTEAVTCSVCYEIFRQPHMINPCGHTACAGCLFAWFSSENSLVRPLPPREGQFKPFGDHASRSRKCMTCQAEVRAPPSVNYVVNDLVDTVKGRLEKERVASGNNPPAAEVAHTPAGSSTTAISNGPDLLLKALKDVGIISRDAAFVPRAPFGFAWSDVWKYVFPNDVRGSRGRWYHDDEDHVRRCGQCNHELEGPGCLFCGEVFSDLEDDDDLMFGNEDEDAMSFNSDDHRELQVRANMARTAGRFLARNRGANAAQGEAHGDHRGHAFMDLEALMQDEDHVESEEEEDLFMRNYGRMDHQAAEGFSEHDESGSDLVLSEYEGSFIDDGDEEEYDEETEDELGDVRNRRNNVAAAFRPRGTRAVSSEAESDEVEIIGHGEPVARRRNQGPPRGQLSPTYAGPIEDKEVSDPDDLDATAPRSSTQRRGLQGSVIDLESEGEDGSAGDELPIVTTDEEAELRPRRSQQRVPAEIRIEGTSRRPVGSTAGERRRNGRPTIVESDEEEATEDEVAPRASLLERLRGRRRTSVEDHEESDEYEERDVDEDGNEPRSEDESVGEHDYASNPGESDDGVHDAYW